MDHDYGDTFVMYITTTTVFNTEFMCRYAENVQ